MQLFQENESKMFEWLFDLLQAYSKAFFIILRKNSETLQNRDRLIIYFSFQSRPIHNFLNFRESVWSALLLPSSAVAFCLFKTVHSKKDDLDNVHFISEYI